MSEVTPPEPDKQAQGPPEPEAPAAQVPPEPDTPQEQTPPVPDTPAPSQQKSAEQRKSQLDSALQLKGAQGWRIENRSDYQATVAKGKEHSHILHLILTILTAGLWGLFVWLPLTVFGGLKRRMITIDEYGNTVEQKL